MKKYKFISVLMLALFFIGFNNISRADSYLVTYRDAGCTNPYGGYNIDCTDGGSFSIGGFCPPGDQSGSCSPTTNYTAGSNNTLSISHWITFATDKKEYLPNENIIPIFSADSDLTVVCPAKYTKTLSASGLSVSNLLARIPSIFFGKIVFTSPTWVNSFSINDPGDYTLSADMKRDPLAYPNDCNDSVSTVIDIQKLQSDGYFGMGGLNATFTVKMLPPKILPSLLIK